jgi:hypothetical protein
MVQGPAGGQTRRVTVSEDRASDRRIAVAFVIVLIAVVVLAFLADAGSFPLWMWLILTISVVLVAGLVFMVVDARSEGRPVFRRPQRPPRD